MVCYVSYEYRKAKESVNSAPIRIIQELHVETLLLSGKHLLKVREISFSQYEYKIYKLFVKRPGDIDVENSRIARKKKNSIRPNQPKRMRIENKLHKQKSECERFHRERLSLTTQLQHCHLYTYLNVYPSYRTFVLSIFCDTDREIRYFP